MTKLLLKRLTRFGLKSLLASMAVVALWCGYYASQVQSRQQALALVAELGGVAWQRTLGGNDEPSLAEELAAGYRGAVYRLFGDVLRPQVSAIDLTGAELSEGDLATLSALSELQWLSLGESSIDNAGIAALEEFPGLRWLDLSGTDVSLEQLRQIDGMTQLEWLDVSNTSIEREALGELERLFPSATIGLSFSPAIYAASDQPDETNSPADGDVVGQIAERASLWKSLRDDPYDKDRLTEYLAAIGQTSAVNFPQWRLSGVYKAERLGQQPLLILQIYNGTRLSFSLGTMLVFDSAGKLVRTMPGERVDYSLDGPSKQVGWYQDPVRREKIERWNGVEQRREVLDLPDLNDDGFDEIPTQRWGEAWGAVRGDGTAIYTTSRDGIPCIFRLGVPNSTTRGSLIDLTGMSIELVYRSAGDKTLILQTPCYDATPAGTTLLADLPKRRLAAFVWNEEAGTFLGPAEGPRGSGTVFAGLPDDRQNVWVVLPP